MQPTMDLLVRLDAIGSSVSTNSHPGEKGRQHFAEAP